MFNKGCSKIGDGSPYKIICCQSFEHAQRLAATDFDRRLVVKVIYKLAISGY